MSEQAHPLTLELALTADQLDALASRVAAILAADVPEESSSYLDVEGACDFLACKHSRVYALVSAGRLPHYKDGSRLLFDREELRAYVANGGAKRP